MEAGSQCFHGLAVGYTCATCQLACPANAVRGPYTAETSQRAFCATPIPVPCPPPRPHVPTDTPVVPPARRFFGLALLVLLLVGGKLVDVLIKVAMQVRTVGGGVWAFLFQNFRLEYV